MSGINRESGRSEPRTGESRDGELVRGECRDGELGHGESVELNVYVLNV
jgi:hypothetical protein